MATRTFQVPRGQQIDPQRDAADFMRRERESAITDAARLEGQARAIEANTFEANRNRPARGNGRARTPEAPSVSPGAVVAMQVAGAQRAQQAGQTITPQPGEDTEALRARLDAATYMAGLGDQTETGLLDIYTGLRNANIDLATLPETGATKQQIIDAIQQYISGRSESGAAVPTPGDQGESGTHNPRGPYLPDGSLPPDERLDQGLASTGRTLGRYAGAAAINRAVPAAMRWTERALTGALPGSGEVPQVRMAGRVRSNAPIRAVMREATPPTTTALSTNVRRNWQYYNPNNIDPPAPVARPSGQPYSSPTLGRAAANAERTAATEAAEQAAATGGGRMARLGRWARGAGRGLPVVGAAIEQSAMIPDAARGTMTEEQKARTVTNSLLLGAAAIPGIQPAALTAKTILDGLDAIPYVRDYTTVPAERALLEGYRGWRDILTGRAFR